VEVWGLPDYRQPTTDNRLPTTDNQQTTTRTRDS
jgi:hypothetical protein